MDNKTYTKSCFISQHVAIAKCTVWGANWEAEGA